MIDKKKIILVSSPYYLPGYEAGGALRTVANMVDQLGDKVDFRIITRDRDAFMKEPYSNVQSEVWGSLGNAKVFYVNGNKLTFEYWRNIFKSISYDVLYMNSLFSSIFTLRPLLLRRLGLVRNRTVLLAPRGELDPGALGLKSYKKKLFLKFARILGLYNGVYFQATSEKEKENIKTIFPFSQIIIAQDLPVFPVEKKWLGNMNQTTELKLVFLSRIGPKKNLLFALDVFRRCKINIVFDIYGPIDDAKYWERCQAVIHEMGSNVRVTYGGPIPYYEVSEVLSQYHYFILPTLGENFCHAVFEAFSAGCPVIISDKTFWRGLDEKHIGWDISLEEDWVELIERCATIDANEYLEMRTSCFEFARSHVSTSEALESSYRMLVELT